MYDVQNAPSKTFWMIYTPDGQKYTPWVKLSIAQNVIDRPHCMKKRSVNFEMSFWCLQISQKINEIFVRVSALASKDVNSKKVV